MKKPLDILHKGFFSIYYFSCFLFFLSCFGMIVINQNYQLKAAENLKEIAKYQEVESIIIHELQCELFQDSNYTKNSSISYQYQIGEKDITVSVTSPIQEMMFITYENHLIYDYDVAR